MNGQFSMAMLNNQRVDDLYIYMVVDQNSFNPGTAILRE